MNTEPTATDPIARLEQWLEDAKQHPQITEPTAMSLATSTPDGQPSVRIILLKGLDKRGAVFYTNSGSQKGQELSINPKASLCFYWMPLGRQVRLSGPISPVSDKEADAYFASRRRGSQIGAWASDQSKPLESREVLEKQIAHFTEKFDGETIARPPHWSGWRLAPREIEFWQEGEFRLHTRERYRKQASGGWAIELLNP